MRTEYGAWRSEAESVQCFQLHLDKEMGLLRACIKISDVPKAYDFHSVFQGEEKTSLSHVNCKLASDKTQCLHSTPLPPSLTTAPS